MLIAVTSLQFTNYPGGEGAAYLTAAEFNPLLAYVSGGGKGAMAGATWGPGRRPEPGRRVARRPRQRRHAALRYRGARSIAARTGAADLADKTAAPSITGTVRVRSGAPEPLIIDVQQALARLRAQDPSATER